MYQGKVIGQGDREGRPYNTTIHIITVIYSIVGVILRGRPGSSVRQVMLALLHVE